MPIDRIFSFRKRASEVQGDRWTPTVAVLIVVGVLLIVIVWLLVKR